MFFASAFFIAVTPWLFRPLARWRCCAVLIALLLGFPEIAKWLPDQFY